MPLHISWAKKFAANLTSFGARRNELSAHSDLTEENLQEHNQRQAAVNARNSKCSPYYKGLTDQSLATGCRSISVSSPERASHVTNFLRERVSEPESKQTFPRLSSVKSEPKAQVGDDVPATGKARRRVERDDKVLKAAEQNPNLVDVNGVTSNKDKGASVGNTLVEEEFVWATKYRPKALKDFICNRDKALSLQGPVSYPLYNQN